MKRKLKNFDEVNMSDLIVELFGEYQKVCEHITTDEEWLAFIDVVKYLVEKGADITADDNYALRWASENGHIEVVEYLENVVKEKGV